MNQKKHLETAIKAGTPVLLWGAPGVGKTAAIKALAAKEGYNIEIVLASIREPSDFLGLPIVASGEAKFAAPDWAKRLETAEKPLLFLDEISTAAPAVQAALLRVVLDKCVGDLELPPHTRIVAAANPPEIAAGGWELSPPLANRFVHLEWTLDAQEWTQEFPLYWGNPPVVDGVPETEWARARAMVAGFIARKPSALLQTPDPERAGRAWASPRSWDNASRMVAVVLFNGGAVEDALPLVSGAIGEGTAIEFITWAREANLPTPEEVLGDPNYQLPARGDIAYAILQTCSAYAQQKVAEDTQVWLTCAHLMSRAANAGHADIAGIVFKNLLKVRPTSVSIPPEIVKPFTALLKTAGDI